MASHRAAAYLWGIRRPPDDPPELILIRRSREAHLPGVVVHRPRDHRDLNPARRCGIPTTNILGYEVDFWVIDTPIVLECDSWEFHDKRRDRYERDRQRDAELAAAGYITVRFTFAKLTRQPEWVAAMIRAAVDRWAHRRTPPL